MVLEEAFSIKKSSLNTKEIMNEISAVLKYL